MADMWWNDGWLKAAVRSAHRSAAVKDQALARQLCRWRHVARTIGVTFAGAQIAIMRATAPDAHLLEKGARPHEIAPHRLALKFEHGDGGFARSPVEHPGFRGQPFMGPATAAFPAIYNAEARARLR